MVQEDLERQRPDIPGVPIFGFRVSSPLGHVHGAPTRPDVTRVVPRTSSETFEHQERESRGTSTFLLVRYLLIPLLGSSPDGGCPSEGREDEFRPEGGVTSWVTQGEPTLT